MFETNEDTMIAASETFEGVSSDTADFLGKMGNQDTPESSVCDSETVDFYRAIG